MWIIETLYTYGWDKVNDDTFETEEEADADLEEHLNGCDSAFELGYLDAKADRDAWRTREVEDE